MHRSPATAPARSRSLRQAAAAFARQPHGFTGVEKALLICVALAIVLLVASLIRGGSDKAAGDAARVLSTAQGGTAALGQAVDPARAAEVAAPASSPQPAAVVTAPAAQQKEPPGFFGQVGGFFVGIYDGGKDAVVGLGSLAVGSWNLTGGWLINPEASHKTWDTLTGTVSTVVHEPGKVWDAVTEPYTTAWGEGRYGEAIGRGTFEVVTLVLGTKGVDKVAKAGELSKVSEVAAGLEKVAALERLVTPAVLWLLSRTPSM